ncbi:spore germination protein [Staphylospora marina]|uniref:spore germination protein n=1 Tax=Staphylospora marina TaxID=2490858 RepID=UPI000F5B9C7A|nr:spore germination protein [Staphylospora marina]
MPPRWSRKKDSKSKTEEKNGQTRTSISHPKNLEIPLSEELEENTRLLEALYDGSYDFIVRRFLLGGTRPAVVMYFKSMSNSEALNEHVLRPLMNKPSVAPDIEEIIEILLPVAYTEKLEKLSDCVEQLGRGNAVLLMDDMCRGIGIGVAVLKSRGIAEPDAEPSIRGPKDGFNESLNTNVNLLRSRIRSPFLRLEMMKIGRYSQTPVVIAWIKGVTDADVLAEVRRRLKRIDIDGILDSGNIEELIEDNPYSPFPQIQQTERVDIVAGSLMEGRVAILMEGSPGVLVVPLTFPTLMQASEDYYNRHMAATAFRWLRFFLYFLSLTFPSFYVATITFHPEAIPTDQLITFAGARERIPLPTLVEALLMETAFEALREAGLRLPKIVGPAISIVGALVIGEAAVSAGLVSAPVVIVVAATAIASFTIPRYYAGLSFRLLRFPMIILGGTLGIAGLVLGLIAIVIHMSTLRSFGVPYLSPMAPFHGTAMKDVLARVPIWKKNYRPGMLETPNPRRQGYGQRPGPDQGLDVPSERGETT